MPNSPRLANDTPTSAQILTSSSWKESATPLSRIVRNPHLYPIVYRTLRRVVGRRFPFAVFYEVTADEIQVIAVFHSCAIRTDGSREWANTDWIANSDICFYVAGVKSNSREQRPRINPSNASRRRRRRTSTRSFQDR